MSSFIEQRRDPLLSEPFFLEQIEDYKESSYFDPSWWAKINDPLHERWSDPHRRPTRSMASESMFMDNLEHAILLYSGGASHEDVRACLSIVKKELLRHKKEFLDGVFYYWEQDAYQYLLWMFSLSILYEQDEMLPSWYAISAKIRKETMIRCGAYCWLAWVIPVFLAVPNPILQRFIALYSMPSREMV